VPKRAPKSAKTGPEKCQNGPPKTRKRAPKMRKRAPKMRKRPRFWGNGPDFGETDQILTKTGKCGSGKWVICKMQPHFAFFRRISSCLRATHTQSSISVCYVRTYGLSTRLFRNLPCRKLPQLSSRYPSKIVPAPITATAHKFWVYARVVVMWLQRSLHG